MWAGDKLIMNHVHTLESMLGHGWPDLRRNSAQVLTDKNDLVTARFKSQDSVEFLGSVAHIYTLASVQPIWNPVESMQAHYMVNPEDAGIPQIILQTGDGVAVTLLPYLLRVERWEPQFCPLVKTASGGAPVEAPIANTSCSRHTS